MAPIIGHHFIDLKIDTDRHLHGEEVAKRLRGDRRGGIPWMVITDAAGVELVTSDGPGGNCGCPVTPDERAWFVEMIRRSAPEVTLAEIGTIEAELAAYAEELGR
ncbi:MAG: hypothetical protein AAGB93_16840 [Planctomycetota bacterium]